MANYSVWLGGIDCSAGIRRSPCNANLPSKDIDILYQLLRGEDHAYVGSLLIALPNQTFVHSMICAQPDGDSQNIDFSSDPDVFAYVPQIKLMMKKQSKSSMLTRFFISLS